MKRIIMFVLLFAALKVAGQTTGYLRFDTVKVMKQNGTCELYLINKTKDSLGLLTNVGGGLTQFRRSKMLNDSTITVGLDTLLIRGSGGSGITQLTGDVTAGPGSGSQVATLANTAVTPGSYTNLNATIDSKGRITAASNGSAAGGSAEVDTTRKYYPLFILAGESNIGAAIPNSGLSAGEMAANPFVQWLNNSNFLFEPLEIGVNNNINVNASLTLHGPELQLAKSVADGEFLTDTVYAVKIARNGAHIQQLIDSLPTAYARIDTAVAQMKLKGYYPQVYIFYSQGINDPGVGTDTITWRNKTQFYINALRARSPYFAPVFQTVLPVGSVGNAYNPTIEKQPYWDGFTWVVPTAGLGMLDANHWDSTGMSTIVKRMVALATDTVGQRDKYDETKSNRQFGFAQHSSLNVDNESTIQGIRLRRYLASQYIGYNSTLTSLANYNTGSGYNTFASNTTGYENTANGFAALAANTTGIDNTAVGAVALTSNTTGQTNTANGAYALYSNTTGSNNTAGGYGALSIITTTSNNTAYGTNAMQAASGCSGSTAVGVTSLRNNTGDNNTASGYNSLFTNTSGVYNSAVGAFSLFSNTTGSHSIAIGVEALYSNTTSSRSIAMGTNALHNAIGASNIAIGVEAGGLLTAVSNNTIVGDQALYGPTSLSGMVILGYNVGQMAARSNELWIDNSGTQAPLLHGDFTNDSLKVNGFLRVRDSLSIGKTRVGTSADSVLVMDASNRSVKTIAQSSLGADGNGIYTGSGSLPANVTVTGANNSITFDDIFAFRVNSDYSVKAKANGTGIYTESVIGAPNGYEIGYTPVAGIFSKGAGVFIDTNNNVGIGALPPTAIPLYASGVSLFVQGLQSNAGNFLRVDNLNATGNIGLTSYFITVDATGGNVTLTLPAASAAFGNNMGITYKLQRLDNSGNTVTIQRAGSDTINGGTSFTLTTQFTDIKHIQCTSTSTWAQW